MGPNDKLCACGPGRFIPSAGDSFARCTKCRGVYALVPTPRANDLISELETLTASLAAERAEHGRTREQLTKAREGVARYVNSQGRRLYESWREHLIECCDLERSMSGPYPVVKAALKEST